MGTSMLKPCIPWISEYTTSFSICHRLQISLTLDVMPGVKPPPPHEFIVLNIVSIFLVSCSASYSRMSCLSRLFNVTVLSPSGSRIDDLLPLLSSVAYQNPDSVQW